MNVYLAVDVGTTNWKTAAFDENGQLVAIEKAKAKTHYDGVSSWFDADELWESIIVLLKRLVCRLNGYTICSIACTGMGESVVALDANDRPLNKICAWFDTSTQKYAERIGAYFSEETIFKKTGLDVHPSFVLSKWLAMRDQIPGIEKKCSHLLQLPEYVTYKLCGFAYTECALASRTMMYNIAQNDWDCDLLEFAGITREQLPKVVNAGTFIAGISDKAAEDTGLPKTIAVAMGGHDHPCATIAAGVAVGNKILDSCGTAESFLYISEDNAPLPEKWSGLRVCRFLDSKKYALWGGIVAGGASVDWAFRQYKNDIDKNKLFLSDDFSYEEFCREYLCDIPRGCDRLFFLPYLRGAGAPYWDAGIRGGYLGLSTEHSSKEMLQAVFEGLALHSRLIRETAQMVSGKVITEFNTVGGAARIIHAQQLKADINGIDVKLYSNNEATLAGCAMLGAIAVGDVADIQSATQICSKVSETVSPRAEITREYDNIYGMYKTLYGRTRDLLADIYSM